MIHSSWSLLCGLAASEAIRPYHLWWTSLLSPLRTEKLPVNMTISNSIPLCCWKETFHCFLSGCLICYTMHVMKRRGPSLPVPHSHFLWGVFLLLQYGTAAAMFTLQDPSE